MIAVFAMVEMLIKIVPVNVLEVALLMVVVFAMMIHQMMMQHALAVQMSVQITMMQAIYLMMDPVAILFQVRKILLILLEIVG